MILVIDNYDSFTFNLVQYLAELGATVEVYRNDRIRVEEIAARSPRAIVISPGPGAPDDAGITLEAIRTFAGRIPILGVCLGHQAIGQAFGGRIVRAPVLMHGKTSMIVHDGRTIFRQHAAQEIEDQEPEMAHSILDVIPEDPEIEHIPAQMQPPAVQEHRREDREDQLRGLVLAKGPPRINIPLREIPDRNHGVGIKKSLQLRRPQEQFVQEREDIEDDERDGDDGITPRRNVIANGNHRLLTSRQPAPRASEEKETFACLAAPDAHGLLDPGRDHNGPRPRAQAEGNTRDAPRYETSPQSWRKFRNRSFPTCPVMMDSGWNCTPSHTNSRWRTPMINPSEDVAETSRHAGTESRSTTSE